MFVNIKFCFFLQKKWRNSSIYWSQREKLIKKKEEIRDRYKYKLLSWLISLMLNSAKINIENIANELNIKWK